MQAELALRERRVMGHFVSAMLGSTEAEWTEIFTRAGKTYKPPTLVMFSGATQSGCGFAKAAMGPFYCPIDQKVYLETKILFRKQAVVAIRAIEFVDSKIAATGMLLHDGQS
jgi:predicted metalloprotease